MVDLIIGLLIFPVAWLIEEKKRAITPVGKLYFTLFVPLLLLPTIGLPIITVSTIHGTIIRKIADGKDFSSQARSVVHQVRTGKQVEVSNSLAMAGVSSGVYKFYTDVQYPIWNYGYIYNMSGEELANSGYYRSKLATSEDYKTFYIQNKVWFGDLGSFSNWLFMAMAMAFPFTVLISLKAWISWILKKEKEEKVSSDDEAA